MSLVKYRLKEVATDFAVSTKVITEILAKYSEKPKSNTQVLTAEELNVVFDYMTQHNQISSLEQVFAVQPKPKAEPAKEAPKAEVKKPEAPKPQQNPPKAQPQAQNKPQNTAQPKAEKPQEPERKRERRVVDTSAVQVNVSRFDDRVDSLISERAQNFQGGKQRIGGGKGKQQQKQQQNPKKGNKARNEE